MAVGGLGGRGHLGGGREARSGDWGITGNPPSTAGVKALAAGELVGQTAAEAPAESRMGVTERHPRGLRPTYRNAVKYGEI
jgi:hypothetical protein